MLLIQTQNSVFISVSTGIHHNNVITSRFILWFQYYISKYWNKFSSRHSSGTPRSLISLPYSDCLLHLDEAVIFVTTIQTSSRFHPFQDIRSREIMIIKHILLNFYTFLNLILQQYPFIVVGFNIF